MAKAIGITDSTAYCSNKPENSNGLSALQYLQYLLYLYITKCLYLVLTLNLLTTTIVAPPSNANKWQMGFNSAFKGLKW